MRSIVMALLAMGNISIRDVPITKHDTPIVSVPDLQIEFEQHNDDTILRYNPCISTKYPLWKGNWLTHSVEISYIIYWIEYQYRKEIDNTWRSSVLSMHLSMADEIEWVSGSYYDLDKSCDVTGATFRDHNRYRLVIEANGFTSNNLMAPQNIHGQFSDQFFSSWIYGKDSGNFKSLVQAKSGSVANNASGNYD